MTSLQSNTRLLAQAEAELLGSASQWRQQHPLWNPTLDDIRKLSQSRGLHFATAALYHRLLEIPINAAFANEVQNAWEPKVSPVEMIGVVPGAFYRQHRHTGADGKRILEIAASLGLRAETIPVRSFGSLADNAEVIAGWLEVRKHHRMLLVSLSKGSSDVKRALMRPDAADCFSNVAAWVSFSGIVQGTPLIGWLKSHSLRHFGVRLLLRLQGHRPSTLAELQWGDNSPLTPWPKLPEGMRLVHVYGFPLQHQLRHPWAPRAYRRIQALGPNDGGGVLLGDLVGLPGIVFPVWGADHYLCPDWDITPLLKNLVLASLNAPLSG